MMLLKHETDNVKVLLATNNTDLVPASKYLLIVHLNGECQPLDVCINKPFRDVLHNFWEHYIANNMTNLTETE